MTVSEQARLLLANMQADIKNAATRQEWMRLTLLAAECERLVQAIDGETQNG